MQSFSSYPDWKAPGEDSAELLWPAAGELLAQMEQNRTRLDDPNGALIQGIPLGELRRKQKQWLNIPADRPLLVTAHQTELYHAGVWAKLALLRAAAKKSGAESIMIVVDTDAPKHLQLRWPRWSQPITDDPRLTTAAWSGLLAGPTPGHIHDLQASLNAAAEAWPFTPAAGAFLQDLSRQSIEQPGLSATITNAMHKLDWDLGLRHQVMLASPLWSSDGYLATAYHILARADHFVTEYNQALHDYRIAHKLRTEARPMPDLKFTTDECEVPFWLDDLIGQSRTRANVQRGKNSWELNVSGEALPFSPDTPGEQAVDQLKKFLHRHNIRLSPRALTLTMFVRLLIADQFVHGIGGGRYDQVTDEVIRKFFGIQPPHFAVTTATLYFPTAVGRNRPCLPCLAHEGHRLRHRVLGEQKMELVRQIDSLPRYSPERQRLFSKIHHLLTAKTATHPNVVAWEKRVEEANRQSLDDSPLFDREFFYAIQPRDRLSGVIERYAAAF
jgi:hypothetical protein